MRMSGAELSKRAKLDRSYVSSIENDSRGSYPKSQTIEKLARALNVTPDELTGRLPPPRPQTPYDSDPRVRSAVDALVTLPDEEQARILDFAEWLLQTINDGRVAKERLESLPSAQPEVKGKQKEPQSDEETIDPLAAKR